MKTIQINERGCLNHQLHEFCLYEYDKMPFMKTPQANAILSMHQIPQLKRTHSKWWTKSFRT